MPPVSRSEAGLRPRVHRWRGRWSPLTKRRHLKTVASQCSTVPPVGRQGTCGHLLEEAGAGGRDRPVLFPSYSQRLAEDECLGLVTRRVSVKDGGVSHSMLLPYPSPLTGPPRDHGTGVPPLGRAVAASALGRVSWVEERTADIRNIPTLRTSGQELDRNLGERGSARDILNTRISAPLFFF